MPKEGVHLETGFRLSAGTQTSLERLQRSPRPASCRAGAPELVKEHAGSPRAWSPRGLGPSVYMGKGLQLRLPEAAGQWEEGWRLLEPAPRQLEAEDAW